MNPIEEVFEELKVEIDKSIEVLKEQHSIPSIPHECKYRNFLGTEHETYDLMILPGSPVQIVFNDQYILSCLLGIRTPEYFQKRLHQAVGKLARMHRTLRHLIPLHTAIALKNESKAFSRIPNPKFLENRLLNSKDLDISYSVTVLDNITGTSISMNGLDPDEIKKEAIHRLSQIIFSREDLMEMMEQIQEMKKFKPDTKEQSITIGGKDGEFRERKTY